MPPFCLFCQTETHFWVLLAPFVCHAVNHLEPLLLLGLFGGPNASFSRACNFYCVFCFMHLELGICEMPFLSFVLTAFWFICSYFFSFFFPF